jgi:SAM-dependent methyltransferase
MSRERADLYSARRVRSRCFIMDLRSTVRSAFSMTTFSEIVELNRGQKVSEIDPFTEGPYKQFVRHLPPGAHDILDVGCNTGRGGVVMKTLHPSLRVTGLDCVPERVQELDPNIYDARICDFTQSISAPSDSFDAIVAGEFNEHLPPDQVDATLCEFFRLLRLRQLSALQANGNRRAVRDPRHARNRELRSLPLCERTRFRTLAAFAANEAANMGLRVASRAARRVPPIAMPAPRFAASRR